MFGSQGNEEIFALQTDIGGHGNWKAAGKVWRLLTLGRNVTGWVNSTGRSRKMRTENCQICNMEVTADTQDSFGRMVRIKPD